MSRIDSFKDVRLSRCEAVKTTDTYCQLFGQQPNYSEICTKESCKMFQAKFKSIYQTGREHGLQEGETAVLISVFTFGRMLENTPYGELDDVKIFVENNAIHFLSFVKPELHALLLRTNYFRKNKHAQFSRNRTARIARILDQLSKHKAKKEKYDKFTEIISKLK